MAYGDTYWSRVIVTVFISKGVNSAIMNIHPEDLKWPLPSRCTSYTGGLGASRTVRLSKNGHRRGKKDEYNNVYSDYLKKYNWRGY